MIVYLVVFVIAHAKHEKKKQQRWRINESSFKMNREYLDNWIRLTDTSARDRQEGDFAWRI